MSLSDFLESDDADVLSAGVSKLREAIEIGQTAVAKAVLDERPPEERAAIRNQLALALWDYADHTGQERDRQALLAELRAAAWELPPDHPLSARHAGNLGLALRDEYLLTGVPELLDEAVATLRAARKAVRTDDPDRSTIDSNLALVLQDQREHTGQTELLDEAIVILADVIGRCEPDDPWRNSLLANLSAMYQDRYEILTDANALNEAVRLAREAVECSAEDDLEPRYLTHLGLALRMRYEITGSVDDLAEAVDASRQAVQLAGEGHPRLSIYLSNLSLALLAAHDHGGDEQVLEESIATARQATFAQPQGGYRRPAYLSNLALALWTRHRRTGDLPTLDEAIAAYREAIDKAEPDALDFDLYRANLGLALWSRCERAYDDDVMAESLRILRDVIDRTSRDHVEYPTYMSNLSEAFYLRFRTLGRLADLNAAIDLASESVACAPDDHVDKVRFGSNLGALFQARHQRTGDLADLRTAIELFEGAVARTSSDHADVGLYRFNLGDALRQFAASTADEPSAREAKEQLGAAAAATLATPSLRVESGWAAGRLAADSGDYASASDWLSAAVGMLHRVAPLHLQFADQAHQLGQFLGLVSDAASCLIRCGRPVDALVVLEEGRGLILQQAIAPDSAIAALRVREPELADRLTWLRAILDPRSPLSADGPAPGGQADPRDRRHALHNEWYQLLDEIRSRPGLDRFLLPPRPAELMSADRLNPVAVVNVSRYGSHALIAADGQVRPIALPAADPGQVAEHEQGLRNALSLVLNSTGASLRSAERRFNAKFGEVTGWLSEAVVAPVLDDLSAKRPAPESVCWSPTGLLSLLPLHAADRKDDTIHCYTPTIRATLRNGFPPDGDLAAMIVSSSEALPAAAREALAVRACVDAPILENEAASVRATADGLQENAIVHLAVHAVSDPLDAASGYLELGDGALTIADIVRLRPRRPWLAYLSACETANTGAAIPDEGITIASAFNLIGYPNVVGTLWPAHDETAAEVAAHFYAELRLADGGPALSPAKALHLAIRSVRRTLPDRPLMWAPYLFVGQHWR